MKKLIVLCGEQNTGKTTILNVLLKNKNIAVRIKKYRIKKGFNYGDFVYIINIKNKKVGIASRGDSIIEIDEGYNFIKSYLNSIDVMICTCHKSMVNNIIKKYGKNSAIVIPKMACNTNDNNIVLKEILNNI